MQIYLDNAATTPVAPEVIESMISVLQDDFGNPSSSHGYGRKAKALLENVVELYNTDRPHMSISNLTPQEVHQSLQSLKTERKWKNYYKKKPRFVNLEQDLAENVNQCQD